MCFDIIYTMLYLYKKLQQPTNAHIFIFQNAKWKQEDAVEINNKSEMLENLDYEDSIDNNINEKWENIKTIISETKLQLIEKDEGTETFKNKWYDEECKFAIE